MDDAVDRIRVSQDELERLIPAFEEVFERPGELMSRRPFPRRSSSVYRARRRLASPLRPETAPASGIAAEHGV